MGGYEYLNTRLRAMHSRLLNYEYYLELLSLREVDLVIDSLLNSPYSEELSEALATYSGPMAVNVALKENLSKTTQKILKYAEGKERHLIELLLNKWEAYNIKTIIRGKLKNQSPENILCSIIPMANLKDVHLRELAEQENIEEVMALLSTWGYGLDMELKETILNYYKGQESLHIIEVENLIDKAYFSGLIKELEKKNKNTVFVEAVVRSEIDFLNILTCLKLIYEGYKPTEIGLFYFYIEGGWLKKALFENMLKCEVLEDAFSLLEGTEFFSAIEKGVIYFTETGRLSTMERFLEEVIIKKGCRMYGVDPLSISIVIGYLWKKYNEFVNLRSIVWGMEYGMPTYAIKGELIFV